MRVIWYNLRKSAQGVCYLTVTAIYAPEKIGSGGCVTVIRNSLRKSDLEVCYLTVPFLRYSLRKSTQEVLSHVLYGIV